MSIQWTPDQWSAIEDRGGQLLVSAAAGSGKTAVLVERAVRLLCDEQQPIPADRMLIVTFTKAAAAEMRGRIADRLAQLAAEKPGSRLIRRQRLLLQRASICTIDAFCLQLLKKHFSALEIPPEFGTADENSLFVMRQQVLAQVLEDAYRDPDFCAFADLYGKSRSDAQAGSTVLEVYKFLRSLPDPMGKLDQFDQQWQQDIPFADTRWASSLLATARQGVDSALMLNAQAMEAAREEQEVENAYLPALESDRAALKALQEDIIAHRWDSACDRAQHLKFATLGRLPKGYESPWAAGQVKSLRETVKDIINKQLAPNVFVCTQAEFAQDRAQAAPMVAALCRAVRDFDRRYFEAKVQEKVLEFSDFEHLLLHLLQDDAGNRTPLAEEISQGFDAVMVDEYQDTNALQDSLYRCLAKPDGSNLFFVGDLKQSIYRFRQADPTVFLDKLDRFMPLGQGYPARIDLKNNFRSAPAVIDGINWFFEMLMDRDLGGVEYDDSQKLWAGAPGDYSGGVELRVVRTQERAGDAPIIARRIRQMMDEGFLVRSKDGSQRPVQYEDFCILMRTRGSFDVYAAALEAQGIPVYADVAQDLMDAPHIRPLAALLRVLDNPAQDVYLASVMLSPLFDFTPDDLVHLRSFCPKGSLYGAVAAAHEAAQQNGQQSKASAFYEKLAQLRRLARTLPARRLLDEILAGTGYLAAVGTLENGERCRQELQSFVDRVAEVADQTGLEGLVRLMDAAAENGGMTSDSMGRSQPGCVSIMTVHRSKGLEFPVVFVADTSHEFNLQERRRPVLCHADLGLGLKLRAEGGIYPTAAYKAVNGVLGDEALSDEMRVLYVALTRARDRLILTMAQKDLESALNRLAPFLNGDKPERYTLMHAQSPAHWLLAAAAMHPKAKAIREFCPGQIHWTADAPPIEFVVEEGEEQVQQVLRGTGLPQAPADPGLLAQLKEQFAWRYPGDVLTRLPAKVSVTAVVHRKEEPILQRPAFLSKQGLTAAERGTALHAFLQFADFSAAPADLAAEAQRQKDLGLLSADLVDKLNWAALETFFHSETFRRMQSADKILREYDFITSLPASRVAEPGQETGDARILVQGVADVVLVWADHAEILDYKTDRTRDENALRQSYAGQLELYAQAISRRLDRPVTRCSLYSFAMGKEVAVPLQKISENT